MSKNDTSTHPIQTRKAHGLRWLAVALVAAAALALAACGQDAQTQADYSAADPVEVHVASLKGPTSIGLAQMMDLAAASDDTFHNDFDFQVCGTADEVLPALVQGTVDIACIPANAASVLYAKTGGAVTCLDINTLGVLSVVTADESVNSLADLAGHTVYLTGKGTTPEYVTTYLLEKTGVADEVTLEYKSEATELAALLVSDPAAICVLPEPYVTSVCAKQPDLAARVSLSDAWDELADEGSRMVTGVTVVRTEFLESQPLAVAEFLAAQAASVEAVCADPDAAGEWVVAAGIMDDATLAARAIPSCQLVCLTGAEMQDALAGYLEVLCAQDAASVGGAVPGDDFYYLGD